MNESMKSASALHTEHRLTDLTHESMLGGELTDDELHLVAGAKSKCRETTVEIRCYDKDGNLADHTIDIIPC